MAGKIAVAVDFGTTYSAIGYAHIKDGTNPADISLTVIDEGWPGQGRRTSAKIPTVFKGGPSDFKYGFEVQADPGRVCFAKLFLDPDQVTRAQHLARFTEAPDAHATNALLDGLTTFLRRLRERAFDHMIRQQRWEQAFVDGTPKEYILSVPAIWSDRAKDRTIQCALNAGLGVRGSPGSIQLVTEPEAAAVYTITTLPKGALKVDDIFVVCDAGGGTVDLAAYRIAQLEPALKVDEAAVSHGDLCGSVMLNLRFLNWVEKKLGSFAADSIKEIEDDFNDRIKPKFNGDDTSYYVDAAPDMLDNPTQGLEDGLLSVHKEDLEEVFKPIVDRVIKLLEEQINAVTNTKKSRKIPILLVGGFGSNAYLKTRVVDHFPNCEVVQPPDAWSAVVRGALMRSMVGKRKVRGAYGIKHQTRWSSEHEAGGKYAPYIQDGYKFWSEFEGEWQCSNHMTWYVKKGDEFAEATVISFPFYRNIGLNHSRKFEIDLWAYSEGHEGDTGPLFKDLDCHRIAVLKPDLSGIPRDSFERRRSPSGEYYYKVSYQLEMSFDARISFRLRFDGILYGEVQAEYIDPANNAGGNSP